MRHDQGGPSPSARRVEELSCAVSVVAMHDQRDRLSYRADRCSRSPADSNHAVPRAYTVTLQMVKHCDRFFRSMTGICGKFRPIAAVPKPGEHSGDPSANAGHAPSRYLRDAACTALEIRRTASEITDRALSAAASASG